MTGLDEPERREAFVVGLDALAEAAAVDGWDRLSNRLASLSALAAPVVVCIDGGDPPAALLDAATAASGPILVYRVDSRDVATVGHRDHRHCSLPGRRHADDVRRPPRWHRAAAADRRSMTAREWISTWLARRGLSGPLVLRIGDPFGDASADGDPCRWSIAPDRPLLDLLDAQLRTRLEQRVPPIDDDPAWTLELPLAPELERVAESLGTLANGAVGTRATREEATPGATPLVLVAGAYTPTPPVRLRHGPSWTTVDVHDVQPDRRFLDLRTGVLARVGAGRFRSLRVVAASPQDALAMRVEAQRDRLTAEDDRTTVLRSDGDDGGGGVVIAVHDEVDELHDDMRRLDRLARISVAGPGSSSPPSLEDLVALGFDRLLDGHRRAWAAAWRNAHVAIDGAPEDERSLRFAVFHLLSSARPGEVAVGARGLTGAAYDGHVFWDADVFVLPALAAIAPQSARAMLTYRQRRLPAAREIARRTGQPGARFPWESASTGDDVTPRSVNGVPISTGDREEHIVADVAWSAVQYGRWSGDRTFVDGHGRGLLLDTAAYWAARVRIDADGRGHIDGVMGPDEYHPLVDDDAYTNVLARWHLRQASTVLERTRPAVAARYRMLADCLVDGFDHATGIHEQFAGYFDLEPLTMADVGRPPVAADVILGSPRTTRSQIIKQADVVMAHHLVPDELAPGSAATDLAFYGPRTAHGSSLSPAIQAAVAARAGRTDEAIELFRLAGRIDLDDVTGTTAAGLHLAAMGGVWQAFASGFLGVRPCETSLRIDPRLPDCWREVAMRCRYRGARVEIVARASDVVVRTDRPIIVAVGGAAPTTCTPPASSFELGAAR